MELYDLYLQYPSVQTDSRKIKKGDLFFALKGDLFNGNEYAAQAIKDGAAYAVVDEEQFVVSDKYILVDQVLKALQDLAKHHREQFDIPFLAITGSNGKTTTKELIHAVLSKKYKAYATKGNLNNHIGIPLTILSIPKDAQIAIIEMGANHLKEIAFYCTIAQPNFGLITNCGKAHLEGFGSLENVKKAKGELYDYLKIHQGSIFINSDLDYLKIMAKGIEHQFSYGSEQATIIGNVSNSSSFLKLDITAADLKTTIQTKLVGNYNSSNVLAAVAVGKFFKVKIEDIQSAIEEYSPSNSRSQFLQKDSNTIILDAYNANPTSMKLAIENFHSMNFPRKILFLGEMKEVGKDSQKEHQEMIQLLENLGFKEVYLCGKGYQQIRHPFNYFDNSDELKTFLTKNPVQNAGILIKGSRGSAMEKILETL